MIQHSILYYCYCFCENWIISWVYLTFNYHELNSPYLREFRKHKNIFVKEDFLRSLLGIGHKAYQGNGSLYKLTLFWELFI